ncbi:MAG: hypothetical protein R2822_30680 [Spirosomataceae bacterium]
MKPCFSILFFLLFNFFSLPITFAQSSPIVHAALIFPNQEKHVHGSSLVQLPNGDFLAAWFYGSGERTEDDVKIMGRV